MRKVLLSAFLITLSLCTAVPAGQDQPVASHAAAYADCAEFKDAMNGDWDRIMEAIRELAAEKKQQGELGLLAKLKGMWALRTTAWIAIRHATGPDTCVKEYDRENEQRLDEMTREIRALTEEVKDK